MRRNNFAILTDLFNIISDLISLIIIFNKIICFVTTSSYSPGFCSHCTVLFSLYCTVLTVLYCSHCTVLFSLYCTVGTSKSMFGTITLDRGGTSDQWKLNTVSDLPTIGFNQFSCWLGFLQIHSKFYLTIYANMAVSDTQGTLETFIRWLLNCHLPVTLF